MKREIIFLDVDGTLIDTPRGLEHISKKSKYAIDSLIKDGHLAFIASGRCKCLLPQELRNIKGMNFITTNGAFAYLNDGRVLFSKPMDNDLIEEVNKYCRENGCVYFNEGQDVILTEDTNNLIFKDFCSNWKVDEKLFKNYYPGLTSYMMMCAFSNESAREKFILNFKDKLNVAKQYGYISVDINAIGTNKGVGVKGVLDALDIDYKDAYCFGDGLNDVEMLSLCGKSYAMKNAIDEVKQSAKNIAPDVLDDGFYQIMLENGLIKPIVC